MVIFLLDKGWQTEQGVVFSSLDWLNILITIMSLSSHSVIDVLQEMVGCLFIYLSIIYLFIYFVFFFVAWLLIFGNSDLIDSLFSFFPSLPELLLTEHNHQPQTCTWPCTFFLTALGSVFVDAPAFWRSVNTFSSWTFLLQFSSFLAHLPSWIWRPLLLDGQTMLLFGGGVRPWVCSLFD